MTTNSEKLLLANILGHIKVLKFLAEYVPTEEENKDYVRGQTMAYLQEAAQLEHLAQCCFNPQAYAAMERKLKNET